MVDGADFLNLLLQHVLPKGFHRARDFGLLHPKRKALLARLQYLLQVRLPENPVPASARHALVSLAPRSGERAGVRGKSDQRESFAAHVSISVRANPGNADVLVGRGPHAGEDAGARGIKASMHVSIVRWCGTRIVQQPDSIAATRDLFFAVRPHCAAVGSYTTSECRSPASSSEMILEITSQSPPAMPARICG